MVALARQCSVYGWSNGKEPSIHVECNENKFSQLVGSSIDSSTQPEQVSHMHGRVGQLRQKDCDHDEVALVTCVQRKGQADEGQGVMDHHGFVQEALDGHDESIVQEVTARPDDNLAMFLCVLLSADRVFPKEFGACEDDGANPVDK